LFEHVEELKAEHAEQTSTWMTPLRAVLRVVKVLPQLQVTWVGP
jgi:hypothetical protein